MTTRPQIIIAHAADVGLVEAKASLIRHVTTLAQKAVFRGDFGAVEQAQETLRRLRALETA